MRFDNLTENAMVGILMKLDYKHILRMQGVSKRWCVVLSEYEGFWKSKYELDFGDLQGEDINFQKEYRLAHFKHLNPKVIGLPHSRNAHENVKVFGSKVVSCSLQGLGKIWNLNNMQRVSEFHIQNYVTSLAVNSERIFAGIGNGDVQVFSSSGDHLKVFKAHQNGGELTLHVTNECLITVSSGFSVKTWDLESCECLQECSVPGVTLSAVHGSTVFCGTIQQIVHVVHQTNGFSYAFNVHRDVESICANAEHIFVALLDLLVIDVWKRDTRRRVARMNPVPIDLTLKCDSRWVVGTCSTLVNVWDAKSFKLIRSIRPEHEIDQMDFAGAKFVLGSSHVVRVLDFDYRKRERSSIEEFDHSNKRML